MNDAKEGRNEGSLVETGVYITLINIFGPTYVPFVLFLVSASAEVKSSGAADKCPWKVRTT